MATFTSAQVTDIAVVFGVDSESMTDRLVYFADLISDDDKTKALLDVTAHEAVEDDYVDILPNNANKGAKVSPDAQRALIKKRIAGLLHCKDLLQSSGGGRLVRA
jgi:uncharacterized protein (UPF0261 family)